MSSPTSRTLDLLRKEGYECGVVERRMPHSNVTFDFLGFIDILGIKPGTKGVHAVQTTSASNQSARVKKILAIPAAKQWLEAGNTIEVHGWGKKGKVGERKLWKVNRIPITTDSFVETKDGIAV